MTEAALRVGGLAPEVWVVGNQIHLPSPMADEKIPKLRRGPLSFPSLPV